MTARSWALVALLAAAVLAPAGYFAARQTRADNPKPADAPAVPSVGGMPLFSTWPKDQAPEVAIVLTGQTYGYTSPCGCSKPQRGGLERRANLIAALRKQGWPVVALDLGDLAPVKKVTEQDHLKYKYTMEALREMGYAAVGLGEREFDQQLFQLLSQYTLQKADAPPVVLAANLVGLDDKGKPVAREAMFPGAGKRLMVEAFDVVAKDAKGQSHLPVGVAGVVGPSQYDAIKKIDPQFAFLDNAAVLKDVAAGIKGVTKGTGVNVLLYNGTKAAATATAAAFPDFHVVLCRSDDPEPPQFPTLANDGRTFVVEVGHKGQNVGVVGVFKARAGYELKYQLVPLGEEFLTPDGAEKADPVLQLLEQYRADVKKQNLLAKFVEKPTPHAAQVQNPAANLSFVGSDKCSACHPAEFKVWSDSKHSHAMEALEKSAKRPGLANFDGECVVCHTVGFAQQTGYRNEAETAHLRNVGCESCHGPGSGHAANPVNPDLRAALSPWKAAKEDKLPAKDVLAALAKVKAGDPPPVKLEAKQLQIMQAVRSACMKCHDPENDPKYELEKAMPVIWHSGLKAAGLPGGVAGK